VERILIVDNEPIVRAVMAMVLSDAGYAVQTAAGCHIAIGDHRPRPISTGERSLTVSMSGTRDCQSCS